RLATAEPAVLKPLLLAALATADASVDPPVSDTFRQLRAMLAARVRGLPDGGSLPVPPDWTDEQRDALVRDFVSSPEAHALPAAAAEAVAVELVGYGCDNDRGQPLRVSTTKLEVLLMGWLPMTGLLDDEYVEHLPSVVPAWVRYAARRNSLSDSTVTEILTGIEDFTAQFAEVYDDPERWGPARNAVASILTDIDPERDDADEVFARRIFAVADVPGPGFDPDDEDAFFAVAEQEHPEYAKVFADSTVDPVVDGVDARLHATMHTVVARQLWFDDPPEVWATAQRLLDAGYDRHNVLHALTYALSTQIHGALTGTPGDDDAYRAALDGLPQSWEQAAAESDAGAD
ncbi:MAG TPA: DUF1841 family protein, partial [Actinopolymorphaceae bacterium]|nr:DUF1841 family protein [Actinopolymorphaceae bacterium]